MPLSGAAAGREVAPKCTRCGPKCAHRAYQHVSRHVPARTTAGGIGPAHPPQARRRTPASAGLHGLHVHVVFRHVNYFLFFFHIWLPELLRARLVSFFLEKKHNLYLLRGLFCVAIICVIVCRIIEYCGYWFVGSQGGQSVPVALLGVLGARRSELARWKARAPLLKKAP